MFCFSPPVMLFTLLAEFVMAFYTLWRYKMTTVSRLAFVILTCLGIFQLAEYMICGGLGWTNVEWARLGYASITLLPALGIHMVVALSGKKRPLLVATAYASCAIFVVFYLFAQGAITGQTCYPNYAVFNTHYMGVWPFTFYYYGWMMVGAWLALHWSKELPPTRRKALSALAIGYIVFILPTALFNIVDPSTTKGIPSIMCGFAVLLAFVLVLKVLPISTPVRRGFIKNKP